MAASRRERIGASEILAASRRERIGASESSACVRACACESREQCVVRLVRVRAESSAW